MKRHKILLAALPVLLLFTRCAHDQGNYDYSTLNRITIEGLNEAYTHYRVDQFDYLYIEPELSFESGEQITDLSYEWTLNGTVISTEKICNAKIELPPNATDPAHYNGIFKVTNNTNSLSYYHFFTVVVQTSSSNALFILHELANGDAKLSMQRRDKENAPVVGDVFESNNPDFGVMGQKPAKFLVFSDEIAGPNLNILLTGGERRIVTMNTTLLTMDRYYNAESIGMSLPEGFDFAPTDGYYYAVPYQTYGGMVISNGRGFLFDYQGNQQVYFPTPEELDIVCLYSNFSNMGDAWIIYEGNSRCFGALWASKTATFDSFTPQTGDIPVGNFHAGGYSAMNSSYAFSPGAVFLDNGTAYFYSLELTSDYNPSTWTYSNWGVKSTLVQQHEGLVDENSICHLCPNLYWYISNGNKIVRLYNEAASTPAEWFTVPAERGQIVSMMMDRRADSSLPRRLFVATYDGTNSHIFVIDAETAHTELQAPFTVEGKVVSMVRNGTNWTY